MPAERSFNAGMQIRQRLLLVAGIALSGCAGDGGSLDSDRSESPSPSIEKPVRAVGCPTAHPERPDPPGEFDARRLLGLPLDEARKLAERDDCEVRVVRRDGRPLDITADLGFHRINVWVDENVVTRIEGVG